MRHISELMEKELTLVWCYAVCETLFYPVCHKTDIIHILEKKIRSSHGPADLPEITQQVPSRTETRTWVSRLLSTALCRLSWQEVSLTSPRSSPFPPRVLPCLCGAGSCSGCAENRAFWQRGNPTAAQRTWAWRGRAGATRLGGKAQRFSDQLPTLLNSTSRQKGVGSPCSLRGTDSLTALEWARAERSSGWDERTSGGASIQKPPLPAPPALATRVAPGNPGCWAAGWQDHMPGSPPQP
ncbi:hypothetical protein H8959_019392 [Pygathrix nigripes]